MRAAYTVGRTKLVCHVRTLRGKRVSIRKLASIVGTSYRTLQLIERGFCCRLDIALRIAAHFGVTVNQLWELLPESRDL
jgi:DNA-binding XRE family transcriptional regulator